MQDKKSEARKKNGVLKNEKFKKFYVMCCIYIDKNINNNTKIWDIFSSILKLFGE